MHTYSVGVGEVPGICKPGGEMVVSGSKKKLKITK
jgi:hypothetical protein